MSDIKTCKKNLEKTLKEYYTQVGIKEQNIAIKNIEKKIKNIKNMSENDKKNIEYWNSEQITKDLKNRLDERVKFNTSNALLALCNPECKLSKKIYNLALEKSLEKCNEQGFLPCMSIEDKSFIISRGRKNYNKGLKKNEINKIKEKGAISYCSVWDDASNALLNKK